MRFLFVLGLALILTSALGAEPTAAQRAVVSKYDGQVFSTAGLAKLKEQTNGWTQYQWTDGRFLWANAKQGTFAVVEPSGTEIYRFAADEYEYHFADGRVIKSNPVSKTLTWNVGVGDAAPDFDLPSLDGKNRIKLSALKGQVVVLDFWASWCGPCQNALPGTEALWKTYQPKGLRVLGINIEGDSKKAVANAEKLKLTFPNLVADLGPGGEANWNTVQISDYGIDSIPRGVVIDKKGIIRAMDTVVDDEDLIKKLLAE